MDDYTEVGRPNLKNWDDGFLFVCRFFYSLVLFVLENPKQISKVDSSIISFWRHSINNGTIQFPAYL